MMVLVLFWDAVTVILAFVCICSVWGVGLAFYIGFLLIFSRPLNYLLRPLNYFSRPLKMIETLLKIFRRSLKIIQRPLKII